MWLAVCSPVYCSNWYTTVSKSQTTLQGQQSIACKGQTRGWSSWCPCAKTHEVSTHHPSYATEAHLFHCNTKLYRSCNKKAQGCDNLYTGGARQNTPITEHMHHASKTVIQLSPQVCVNLLAPATNILQHAPPSFLPTTCQSIAHYFYSLEPAMLPRSTF